MAEEKLAYSIYSDEELMIFLREGKVQAFDEIYRRYAQRLMVYFVRMLNYNKAHAEDALQDLFLKIAEKPGSFDTGRVFKTWIFSVASNTCKNYYRHKQVIKESEDLLRHESHKDDMDFSRMAARLDSTLFRRILEELLMALPPEKRECFILKYQEDRSIAEIAAIQDCPEGSVKSRLHYTLRMLEDKLQMFNPVK